MVGDENMINFKNFQKVAELAGEKCALFFTAVTFFKLYQGDYDGRISIMQFFNYVMRKVWLQQTRIGINSTVFKICVHVKLTTLTALILMWSFQVYRFMMSQVEVIFANPTWKIIFWSSFRHFPSFQASNSHFIRFMCAQLFENFSFFSIPYVLEGELFERPF